MRDLIAKAEPIAAHLKARRQTLAVAESSTGGLVSAALLAIPGASAYFLGGAVVYTRAARQALLAIPEAALEGLRPATEAYALLLARAVRDRHAADWAIAETGAAGPEGNRYGDPAGHSALAVTGAVERSVTLETGSRVRLDNMCAFAAAALDLLLAALETGP